MKPARLTSPWSLRGYGAALAVLTLTLAGAMSAAAAGAGGAQQLVEQTIDDLRSAVTADEQTLKQDPDKAVSLVDRIVSPHIDIQRVGQWVLGRYWRTATPEQRTAFVKAFRGMLLRTYAVHVVDYSDVQIDYLPVRSDPGSSRAMVRTQITRSGAPPMEVDYRLYRRDGVWKVYDVIADGISIVATFRAAVGADIEHYGLDGVIARMNAKGVEKVATHSETTR